MMHNPALQPTTNPLRGLSAAELGRYACIEATVDGETLMKKVVTIAAILLSCSTADADNQFALVDSIYIGHSDKTLLSLDALPNAQGRDSVTLKGILWNQETSSMGFQNTEIIIDDPVVDSVHDEGSEIQIGNIVFSKVERKLQVGNQVILRRIFVSENSNSIISVSDDPSPLAIAAFVAGAAVAICGVKTIYDMMKCAEGSKFRIRLADGLTCESGCRSITDINYRA